MLRSSLIAFNETHFEKKNIFTLLIDTQRHLELKLVINQFFLFYFSERKPENRTVLEALLV